MNSRYNPQEKTVNEPKPSQLFLVRVWPGEKSGGEDTWSGKIQHVTSGEARQFEDWTALGPLLHEMLGQEDEGKR